MQSATSLFPLILDGAQLSRLMTPADYLGAAEAAFRAHAQGRTRLPMPLYIEGDGGGLHAKGAYLALDRAWAAVKVNSNFPGNPAKGLPTIQGAVLLFDGTDGRLLAILDSIEITSKRTAAASALAAKHLALADAGTVAILGCGEQGRAQLVAMAAVRPIRHALCWDVDAGKARDCAVAIRAALGIEVTAVATVGEATLDAQIVVTATSATVPFLGRADVRPGTFVAAIGADNPKKNELKADLFTGTRVVVDSIGQASTMGDLHHAIAAGCASRDSVHAELAEIIEGRKQGRTSPDDIVIFDSTGLAIQDVAAAAAAYSRAGSILRTNPCFP